MKTLPALILSAAVTCAVSQLQAGRVIVGYPFGTGSAEPDGHLIINRAANFGKGESIIVYVDGRSVAIVPWGQRFAGSLPAGPHHVAIEAAPISGGLGPVVQKHINIVPGATHVFTVGWIRGDTLVLK